jgi:hypothetical protein
MRNPQPVVLAFLLAAFSTAALAGIPQAHGGFSRQVRGTDRRVPIASAAISDEVYWTVYVEATDGEHHLHFTIYDGAGQEVCNFERATEAQAGEARGVVSCGFDPARDAPGTWWYVAAVDDQIVLSNSLTVSGSRSADTTAAR